MARRDADVPSLVAGLALAAFGTVLLLDALDVVNIRFAALAPMVCALLGAILLAVGLRRQD